MATPNADLELSNVIDAMRRDLLESASTRAKDWNPLFRIEEVTVELQVALEKDDNVEGGLKAWVLTLSASQRVKNAKTHRIIIRMKALDSDSDLTKLAGGKTRPLLRGKPKKKIIRRKSTTSKKTP